MFWILGGQGLTAAEAAAIASFVALGTTPGGYHLAKNGSGFFVNTPDTGSGGGMAIGSPITGATAGSVLFVDATGNLGQDNPVFYWDDTNNRLILGANALDHTASTANINVVETGLALVSAYGYGAAGSTGGLFTGYGVGGTPGAPTAVATGTTLVSLSGRGYDGTAWTPGSQGSIVISTAEAWTSTARGTNITFNTTPTGSTTNTGAAIISSAGNMAIGTTAAQTPKFGVAGTRSAAFPAAGTNIVVFDSTFTDTSSSGTVSTMRSNTFGIPTYVASAATTYTVAANVFIAGAPVASTNVTITNPYALYVSGGTTYLGGAAVVNSSLTANYATASTIAIFDASKNVVSAPTATYPSLTELSYVKGVTSSIQTQINAKGSGDVVGPSSATNNAVALFDTTTGKLLKNSTVTVDANNTLTVPNGGLLVQGSLVSPGGNGGFELEYLSGTAYVTSYNRNTASWVPMVIRGSDMEMWSSGSKKGTWNSNGLSVSANSTIGANATNNYDTLTVVGAGVGGSSAGFHIIGDDGAFTPTQRMYKWRGSGTLYTAWRTRIDNSGGYAIETALPSAPNVSESYTNMLTFTDQAGGSRLGIGGVTAPARRLHVQVDDPYGGAITMSDDGGQNPQLMFHRTNGGGSFFPTAIQGYGVGDMRFLTSGTATTISGATPSVKMTLSASGNLGIGAAITSPTATLHLQAGTATAGTAPIKFNAGTVMTTPEAGTFEFTNSETGLTFTAVSTRRQVVLDTVPQTVSQKRNLPRTASSTTASTLTPDLSSANVYYRTTQTATLTINAPTGTPVIGETIVIYVDSASAQTLTIDSAYKVFGTAFPATTTAGKTFMMSAQFNGIDWKTLWANAV